MPLRKEMKNLRRGISGTGSSWLEEVGEQGGEDFHSTPQYYWPRTDPQTESLRTPGIEIHASTMYHSIRWQSDPRDDGVSACPLIVFVIVSLVTLLCFSMKPTFGVGLSALVLGLFVYIVLVPAFQAGHWLLVVSPVVGGVLAIGLSQTSNYVSEGRQRQQLRSLFSRYVDDRVVDRISQAPEDLNLGGERRNVAVLFADIVGFSTRSENADPAALVRDLNQYFESSVQAIQSRGGMVDKFMGDGIMALFGVPLEDPGPFGACGPSRNRNCGRSRTPEGRIRGARRLPRFESVSASTAGKRSWVTSDPQREWNIPL